MGTPTVRTADIPRMLAPVVRTAVVVETVAATNREVMSRAFSLAVLLCLTAGSASAGEKITFDEKDFDAHLLKAFASAAGLSPIDAKDGDQIRVWFENVMVGDVTGYIVTGKGAWRCKLHYSNDNGEYIVVNKGHCSGPHRYADRIARPMALIAGAARFDGKDFDCGVMDGWSADIEGMVDGKRFTFGASNTEECEDVEVKWVDNFLDSVAAAWSRKGED